MIENPSILEELSAVKRFFIFGDTDKSEKIQFILVGRNPGQIYGYLAAGPTHERHRASKFVLRYWKDALTGPGPTNTIYSLFPIWVSSSRHAP